MSLEEELELANIPGAYAVDKFPAAGGGPDDDDSEWEYEYSTTETEVRPPKAS